MKHYKYIWLFLTFAVFVVQSPLALGASLHFEPGKFQRNDSYNATFSYSSVQLSHCIIAFGDHLGLTQEDKEDLARTIEADVQLFTDRLAGSSLQTPIIYVVLQTVRTGSYAICSSVFCTLEDVQSGQYRSALMQGMLDTNEVWMVRGCLAHVLDESYENDVLVEYVMAHDADIINLFPTRFYSALNTTEELAVAGQIAHSLVDDLIQYDGTTILTSAISEERKQAWQERVGFHLQIDMEKTEYLKQFSFSWDDLYEVIAVSDHSSYSFDAGYAGLNNANIVEDFLYRTSRGRTFLIDYLHSSVSEENADYFAGNLEYIVCEARPMVDELMSRSNKGTSIVIYKLISYPHEIVHIMLGGHKPLIIIEEGLCVYFDLMQPNSYTGEMIRYILIETDRTSGWGVGYEIYNQMGGQTTAEQFDMRTYMDALALFGFAHPNEPASIPLIGMPLSDISNYANLSEDGSDLSYAQGCSFVFYLIDQYGVNCVLDAARKNLSFEDAFGQTFQDVAHKWRIFLEQEIK